MNAARHSVRRLSIRVALIATAVVAAVLGIGAAVTDVVVRHYLVANIDHRLGTRLDFVTSRANEFLVAPRIHLAAGDRQTSEFGVPLALWIVAPSGDVKLSTPVVPTLPASQRHVAAATTTDLGGTPFRLEGGPVPGSGDWLVIGQSVANIENDMHTLLITELVVGPAILGLVFLGSLTVGRRVGHPVEEARQRQLAFTADASHELRTPLAVIQAETALALSRERDAASYRTTIERVAEESTRLRHIVDSLLWLARFDATPGAPGTEPVDLATALQAATERFRPVAENRALTLQVEAVASPAPLVMAPPEWVDRVCGVLLDNACRYTPASGTVRARVMSVDNHVRLCVEDSGPGIPAEQRGLIFDRFHRASDAEGGAGLGLAIGDAVVRATRGHWEVGDSPLGGASLTVTWPRSGDAASAHGALPVPGGAV
jgi:signal transduction histidine kinase